MEEMGIAFTPTLLYTPHSPLTDLQEREGGWLQVRLSRSILPHFLSFSPPSTIFTGAVQAPSGVK
jgi:hypothetical protein